MMIERTQSRGSASPTILAIHHSGEGEIMETITETRTYTPAEVIPAHTLTEFGAARMHREFADLVRGMYPTATINVWTVTLTGRTDDPGYLRTQLIASLDALVAKSINAFA